MLKVMLPCKMRGGRGGGGSLRHNISYGDGSVATQSIGFKHVMVPYRYRYTLHLNQAMAGLSCIHISLLKTYSIESNKN
jgi:hypothetical protein